MADGPGGSPSQQREQRVDEAIATYLAGADAGRPPDRQAWLASFPDLAPELEEFLADQDRFNSLVRPQAPEAPSVFLAINSDFPAALGTDGDLATAEFIPEDVESVGAGSRSFGPYELLGKIGEGGQGVVFKAREDTPHRIVALKLIRSGPLASNEEIRRFRDEADAAAELDHAHIVPIYHVSEHRGQWYFSMRFMEGGSLARRLSHYSTHPREAAALMVRVARAVQHAHRHGILHRDLKPSNILFDAEGQPYVTDFGLAKRVTPDAEATVSGVIVGTAQYMAPEQALGKKGVVTTASDVYGLGAILYSMLAGQPPFRGDSWVEILEQVKIREPELPSARNRKVSRDLETICLTCLRKDPQRRYESAEALAEDLERWLAGEPIRARRTGAWERTIKWVQRRPAIAGLLGTVILVAALGFISVAWQLRQTKRLFAEADLTNYLNRIALANEAWSSNNFGRAAELLAGCPGKQRDWEWYYLMGLRQTAPVRFQGHAGTVYSVAFSPDGRYLASAGADWMIQVRDLASGGTIQTLTGHEDTVRCVAFSPLGSCLASASWDGKVKIWDIAAGHLVHDLVGHAGRVISAAYSPDGKRLASAGADGSVRIWDVETGELVGEPMVHGDTVLSIAYSPDGQRIASASDDGVVKLWDAAAARPILTAPENIEIPRGMAFSPDGLHLALACGDGVIRVLDTETGRVVLRSRSAHTDAVRGVAYGPEGTRLASVGGDGAVKVWNAATGQEAITLHADRNLLARSVAFGPARDPVRLAVAYDDGTIGVWQAPRDTSRCDALRVLTGHEGVVYGAAYSLDGQHIATASGDRTIRIWEAATGRERFVLKGHLSQVYSVAWSPDGKHLASAGADKVIRIWDATAGGPVRTLPGHADDIWCVAYSRDGRLASVDGKGIVRLWDATTGRAIRTIAAEDLGVWSAAFSPDGNRLLLGCGGGIIQIWDTIAEERKPLLAWKGHERNVYGVTFSPDGQRIASAGEEGTIRIWDAQTGRAGTSCVFSSRCDGVAFSPDGKLLAAAIGDGTIKVWDVGTDRQELRLVLYGHTSRVLCVAFSPDGRCLVSAGFDASVRVWDTTGWSHRHGDPAPGSGR
jgi:WD40 repeat protein/tRNA A-37 threonylcarbamoyl transferase component Bud32